MWQLAVPWWELVLRSFVVYVAMLAMLRIFGKREVGQFTLFDLVLILLVANAVQPAMTGPDSSLLGGLVIIATLIGTDRVVAFARSRVPFFRRLIESEPTVIARDGTWLTEAMEREDLTVDDAEMALREHGVGSVEEVELAVLEGDGSISVVPRERDSATERRRPRRRIRLIRHL
jgi:uncharacterized membrane protein YcaP (DUF421 family)